MGPLNRMVGLISGLRSLRILFFWLVVRKVLKSPKFSITAEGGLAKKNGDDAAGGGGGGGG